MRRMIVSIVLFLAVSISVPTCVVAQGMQDLPSFGLEGAGWAEVLSVTPKWVVLQTADGRQYPVSGQAMGRFIVRWPILPTMVSASALVEVEGASPSVNMIVTDNVEVYEGAARNFVQPSFLTPTDAGILRQYDATYTFGFDSMNQFWSMYPSQPAVGMQNVPLMTYMVAPVVNIVPLMLGTPSNQMLRVVPANGRTYEMTRIVVGTLDQLRPGDLVYAVPEAATPKGMGLSVIIVYKKELPIANPR